MNDLDLLPPEHRAQWTDGTGAERAGTVWSAGPVTDTFWVVPDERREGEGLAVCLYRIRAGVYRHRKVDVERSGEDWQRRRLAELAHRPQRPSWMRGIDQFDYVRAHRAPVTWRGVTV